MTTSDGSAALWESYFETAPNIKTPPAYVANKVALNSSSDQLVYSFDYGNSIFIGLDVPGDVGGAGGSQLLTDAQLTFLDAPSDVCRRRRINPRLYLLPRA